MRDDGLLSRLRALADLRRWNDLEVAAREALEAASAEDLPSDVRPVVTAHLARALLLLDRIDEAIQVAADGVATHPGDDWLGRVLTSALVAGGRTDEADEVLGRLLATDPDGYHVRVLAARVALRRFDHTTAESHAQAAILAAPDRAGGHVMLAAACSQSGRPLEAEAAARRGLEVDPGSGDLHGQLAIALERSGRRPEAAQHWLEAGRVGRYPQVAIEGLVGMLDEPPRHGVWFAVGGVAAGLSLLGCGLLIGDPWAATVIGIAIAAVVTLLVSPLVAALLERRRRRRLLASLPADARSIIELAGD